MVPQSIEDLAATYMAGETDPTECYCQEFAHTVFLQSAEIKELKEKLKFYARLHQAAEIKKLRRRNMQIRFNDTEVKDIVRKYVLAEYPVIGGKDITVDGYIGDVRVEVIDKLPQPEQF